jgi:hypothetical protein
MPANSTLEIVAWLPAIATIASGFLAGAVALGVTWMNHRFTHRREAAKTAADRAAARKDRLREKLEELLAFASEHADFRSAEGMHVASMGIHAARGQAIPDRDPDPSGARALNRARAIISLYFPELDGSMRTIEAGTTSHLEFIRREIDLLASDAAAWQAESEPTFGRRSSEAMADILRGNIALAQAARTWINQNYP